MFCPTIGISSDTILIRDVAPGAGVYGFYIQALIEGAGGLPWIIPPFGASLDLNALADRLDGLVLSGAISNIEPHRYGGPPDYEGATHDPARDDTSLPLVPLVLERGIPLLGICRGMQEINVALGGSLHQEVHEVPGYQDHRADPEASLADKFAPAHGIEIEPGGVLADIAGQGGFMVNSVHFQGIDRLAQTLKIEARAPDGLIEALSVNGAKGFTLAVQWHPEWQFDLNPLYRSIWSAFGQACADYAARRIDAS